jgi:hypothetical protein
MFKNMHQFNHENNLNRTVIKMRNLYMPSCFSSLMGQIRFGAITARENLFQRSQNTGSI